MSNLKNMPFAGMIVIFVILAMFTLAVIMLFSICARYRHCANLAARGDSSNGFMRSTYDDFAAAYKTFGQDVNTPAIITSSISTRMSFALFCERFLNNAVSLFVTLGLFGTFLGLSLSVSSLTELIGYSNTSEWLNVLDSVGGGLMSALSGMGVAFYTSLVGVACSIILTILRAVMSPESLRATLETELELWLDHRVSPTLTTERTKDDSELIRMMIKGLDNAADSMNRTLKDTTGALETSLDNTRLQLTAFSNTVESFNEGVRNFEEFDYNLRGTIERMDSAARDFTSAVRMVVNRSAERSAK